MTWIPTPPAQIPSPDALQALYPDNASRQITAKASRDAIQAITSSIHHLAAEVARMAEVNAAVIGQIQPWTATDTYPAGVKVLHAGQVFLALKSHPAGEPAPVAGSGWAILDYVSQYATLVDMELKLADHETRLASLEPPGDPTHVLRGSPGLFVLPGNGGSNTIANTPQDLPSLKALGDLGETVAWKTGEFVVLGDAGTAYWTGTEWKAGKTP